MLLLPNPKRLLLGYLAGALLTSVTLGLVIVFSLQDSGAVSTQKNTISPSIDLALGAILLIVAFVLATDRHAPLQERRAKRKAEGEPKDPPRWQRALSKGTARTTFVVGALLTLPGGSYLAGLSQIDKLDLVTVGTVLTVLGFNLIMLILLEAPLIGYTVAPEWTPRAIDRARDWLARRGRHLATIVAAVLGAALVIRGLVQLLG
jgi:hypothetical protein